MTKWQRLTEPKDDTIRRGAILRCWGVHPYEKVVDFMVFDPLDRDAGMGLMVASGYKAGLTLVHLPLSSCGQYRDINTKWLVKNWKKWVYPNAKPNEVFVMLHKALPKIPSE